MRPSRVSLRTVSSLALASMTALAATASHAVEVGRARLLSPPAQPLVLSVALRDWKPDETLSIQFPEKEQWQQAGLTPPVALEGWQIELQPQRSQIIVRSPQAVDAKVIDVLLDIQSSSGLQRHQVSVVNAAKVAESLQLPSASPTGTRDYSTPSAATSTVTPNTGSYQVRNGDTLGAIAAQRTPAGVSTYQYMAALLAANPHAFQHGNMNLLRAGSTLQEPTTEQLQAYSDAEARKMFGDQAQWFAQYKRQLAENKSPALAVAEATTGVTRPVESAAPAKLSAKGDSLTLSTESWADSVKQDQAVATAQALSNTVENIEQLEENVRQLASAVSENEARVSDSANNDVAATTATTSAAAQSSESTTTDTATTPSGTGEVDKNDAKASASMAEPAEKNTSSITDTGSTLSWIQEHLLIVMSALLALIVIITVWVLRRANNSRAEIDSPAPVTPEMVREKLEKINLDLDVPPSDEPTPSERKPS